MGSRGGPATYSDPFGLIPPPSRGTYGSKVCQFIQAFVQAETAGFECEVNVSCTSAPDGGHFGGLVGR